MNMTKISNSVSSKMVRFGSVVALAATFVVGASSSASAQGYGQNNGSNRDWRDNGSQRDDRDWRDDDNRRDDHDWRDNDNQRDDRDWRDNDGHRWDRNAPFRDRRFGGNRHQYSYNGRGYDYTVDGRRGNMDAREVAQRAAQNGYRQGIYDAQYDARGRNSRPNPSGHGAYQFALDGWSQEWGSGTVYQSAYRQAYMRGYTEVFSHGQRPGRRF